MKLILPIVILLTCASVASAQDSVRLWADLKPGWSERYQLRSRIELRSGDELLERLEQDITVRIAAVARDDDDAEGAGRATLRATIERLEVAQTSGGDTVRMIHPAPDGDIDYETSPALDRIYAALAEAVLEFDVAPSGQARVVSGLDTALAAAQAAEPRNPARLLGTFAPGAIERTIAAIITLDPHREERESSDTWRDEQTVPIIGRRAQVITDYALREVQEGEAHVKGETTIALQPAESPAPTDPRITIAEQSGEIAARWDVAAGRLIERRSDTRIVWHATLATEPPMESRTIAASQLTITLLNEPARR